MVNTQTKGGCVFAKKLLSERNIAQIPCKIRRMSSPPTPIPIPIPTPAPVQQEGPRRARIVFSDLVKIDFFGKMEQEEVKELQEEIFAPRKANKSLEEEQMTRSMIYDEYVEEMLMRHGWLIDNHTGEFPLFETLTIMEDGKQVKILDKLLLQADKNPLFTNMEVDENIPEPNQTIVGFDEELKPIYEPKKPDVVPEVDEIDEDDIETDCDSNASSNLVDYSSSDEEVVDEK